MDCDIGAIVVGASVATQLLMDEIYDLQMHFCSYGPKWHKLQVYEAKNALLEFMYLCFEVYGLKWHKLQVD